MVNNSLIAYGQVNGCFYRPLCTQVIWRKPIFLKPLLSHRKRKYYLAISIGVVAAVAIVQPLLTSQVYSKADAIELVKSIKQSSLYFGSAIATASATVLALMLTLLSLTSQVDTNFDTSTYKGIRLIGIISTATFIGAVFLLLFLSIPIGEFEAIPQFWFKGLYYILSVLNGMLSALMIVGVLVLFDTITTLISKLSPQASSDSKAQSK